LFFITVFLLLALGTLALLDSLRMRLLARASVRLDQTLSGAIMDATLKRPEISSQRLAKQALREFDTLRQVLTGPAIVSMFDAPWVPVYVLVAFLIHPWIGVLALLGAALNLFLAWRNERATSQPLQQANEAAGQAYAGYEFTVASAETVRAIGALDADALDQAATCYLAELYALAPAKSRIVDELPGNFLYLGLAALMLPGARIIHCVRDPRDIGLSIFTFRFHGAHGYAHDLSDLGWYIGEHDRLMAHWKKALPNRILTVKLSDWVDDFDATLARVLGHVDLPHDPNCARFYEGDSRVRTVSYAQVRQPINAQGLGRWRAYENELAPMIKELQSAGGLDGWRDTPVSILRGSKK